jgi:hypothetical protein
MGDVADRPSVPADQVLGPGSVELLVDPLLFHCLTQLPVLRDGHHYRYHRAPMMDNVAVQSLAGSSLMKVMVTTWTGSRAPQHGGPGG